jgi:hypothetical protein
MLYPRATILGATIVVAFFSTCHAGSCLRDLSRTRDLVDRYLEAKAVVSPWAVETVGALVHRQPTPASVAAAEEKLGTLDPRMFQTIADAMRRARAADRAGDIDACEQALSEVQLAIGPRICGRSICR